MGEHLHGDGERHDEETEDIAQEGVVKKEGIVELEEKRKGSQRGGRRGCRNGRGRGDRHGRRGRARRWHDEGAAEVEDETEPDISEEDASSSGDSNMRRSLGRPHRAGASCP